MESEDEKTGEDRNIRPLVSSSANIPSMRSPFLAAEELASGGVELGIGGKSGCYCADREDKNRRQSAVPEAISNLIGAKNKTTYLSLRM